MVQRSFLGAYGPFVIAAIAGAVSALGQAPYDQPLALMFGLTVAFALMQLPRSMMQMALIGAAFGCGYFSLALAWITEPFMIDADRYGWMAPFALVLLSVGMALFWALAFGAARALSDRTWPLIVTWTGAEMLRAYILTGFPWASPAQAFVDSMVGQGLSWVGPHGINLAMMCVAFALSHAALGRGRVILRTGQIALALCTVALITLPPNAPPASMSAHHIRMIQPNVPQELKWNPDYVRTFFERHLELTAQATEQGAPWPDLVIWPESALPWRLEGAGPTLGMIASAAAGTPVILGANRGQGTRVFNALALLDSAGLPVQVYDKHHIVPFGEYIPLGGLLSRFGIRGMAATEGDGFSRGPGPQLLDLGPLGRALPLICYEAVFAHDVGGTEDRPDLLIQITNDAWFGKNSGPQQHFAQARMRAIEQGLPMLRTANTGISAVIDPWGRVLHSLPLGVMGIIDAPLPLPRDPTIYSVTGDKPLFLFLTMLLCVLTIGALRYRKNIDGPQARA